MQQVRAVEAGSLIGHTIRLEFSSKNGAGLNWSAPLTIKKVVDGKEGPWIGVFSWPTTIDFEETRKLVQIDSLQITDKGLLANVSALDLSNHAVSEATWPVSKASQNKQEIIME